ncbi:MAG: sulfotransferase [Alphaproteobacteria bacterium]|nr:sulfotransferase [Alphaproteobacteria bacterium]MBU2083237.1 sulfotransferase [Alphaproteobacteria bacterium]MBU2144464.1 sulfotransferase [Alphaproteobacteria bacterium]MBU2195521.1 sulfotransferase [Alphaproteobacteria bacterium]
MANPKLPPYIAQRLAKASDLRESGKVDEAIDAYRAVLADAPNLPDSWYNLGWLLRRAGDPAGALEAYDKALALRIDQPEEVHLNKGVIFADDLLDPSQAQASYRAALGINPLYVQARFNLANTLEDLGERARAASEYRILLRQAPRESEPLARLANLSTAKGRDDALITRLEAAIARKDLQPIAKASIGFALGRLLDQVGAFDLAFAAYTKANAFSASSRAAAMPAYNPARQDALVDALIKLPQMVSASPAPGEAIRPVFILGQFRSGSTLLEQILSAHSAVTTAGELPLLGQIAARDLAPYPASLATLAPERAAGLRAKYLEGVAQRFPDAKGIVTDKRPDNYFHIGLILRLFPDARILHTVRDARDTCLSNYFLHLSHEQSYATDLSHLGHRYRAYQRLMNHWKSIAGDQILDVDYDALVSSPETIMRATLDFIGLPFEDACLNFQNSRTPVKTASVWQVREPLYTKSSGRWRNYESHIGPLLEALND